MSWTGSAISLIGDVKMALRVTAAAFDAEIAGLIDAAKDDLKLAGVRVASLDVSEPDPLIKRAIITYCKATFGLDNPDSEKYMASYTSLKQHLCLSSEYQEPPA